MVSHLAACKNMYRDHAFGDATLAWSDPLADQKRIGIAHFGQHSGERRPLLRRV